MYKCMHVLCVHELESCIHARVYVYVYALYMLGCMHEYVYVCGMVQSLGLGRRLGRHRDGSVSATQIGLGRYAKRYIERQKNYEKIITNRKKM